MRQSGIIAAGALFALQNNVSRLAEDHHHARLLADAIEQCDGLTLDPAVVDTNIVIFRIDDSVATAADFCRELKKHGVWMLPFSQRHVRAVTHLHIDQAAATEAGRILQIVFEKIASPQSSSA